jgi:peptidoglycan/xylan/chitin deacetylase (PgdA/CDA1 family)
VLALLGACNALPSTRTGPSPSTASGITVVSLTFDDGLASQYAAAGQLDARGLDGTFYVNSGFLDRNGSMTRSQIQSLAAAGHEIGGHTVNHSDLTTLSADDVAREICNDRVALAGMGFHPTSFAYPFGEFDAGVQQIVRDCGYNSGRGVSGVDDRRTFAETIPPLDAYATRTPPNPKQGTTLATIESYVTAAEQHGGGWVQLVFHHLCDGCDAYSISPANFQALLDWLQPRAASGTVVETTTQVVGGPLQPPVPG